MTNAGQLKQLRTVNRAACEDHLSAGICGDGVTILSVFHPDGAFAVEQHFCRESFGFDLQILPLLRWIEIRHSRAAAPTIFTVS